jgi:hypothetical protein
MSADRRKAAVKHHPGQTGAPHTGQAGAPKRKPAGSHNQVHFYLAQPEHVPADDEERADTMSPEPPGLVQQNPLFSQDSTVRLTPFGSAVIQEDAADFALREIAIRGALQETELQPQASTSAFARSQSLPSLPSMPSVGSDALSTDEMLGAQHAYMSLGTSPMSSASLDPPDPGGADPAFANRCCSPTAHLSVIEAVTHGLAVTQQAAVNRMAIPTCGQQWRRMRLSACTRPPQQAPQKHAWWLHAAPAHANWGCVDALPKQEQPVPADDRGGAQGEPALLDAALARHAAHRLRHERLAGRQRRPAARAARAVRLGQCAYIGPLACCGQCAYIGPPACCAQRVQRELSASASAPILAPWHAAASAPISAPLHAAASAHDSGPTVRFGHCAEIGPAAYLPSADSLVARLHDSGSAHSKWPLCMLPGGLPHVHLTAVLHYVASHVPWSGNRPGPLSLNLLAMILVIVAAPRSCWMSGQCAEAWSRGRACRWRSDGGKAGSAQSVPSNSIHVREVDAPELCGWAACCAQPQGQSSTC